MRSVPISSGQIRALESLQHALFGLDADFQRDCGEADDQEGSLYRLWSTLDAITTLWKEQGEESSDQRSRALALICAHEPSNGSVEQAYHELKLIARAALD